MGLIGAVVCAGPTTTPTGARLHARAGQIRAANCGRMGHPIADKLVFCHESLHLRQKSQDAGYVPEAEQWESDEESDEEDVEQDFIASTINLTEEAVLLLCA